MQMHDHVPQSAIDSAIHVENQAAAKEPARGALESLRELWGFAYEQCGKIFDAGVGLFGQAARSVRHEADVVFFGRDTLPRQGDMLHYGTVEVGEQQLSFDDLMDQQAAMLPPAEIVPDQTPPTIDR